MNHSSGWARFSTQHRFAEVIQEKLIAVQDPSTPPLSTWARHVFCTILGETTIQFEKKSRFDRFVLRGNKLNLQ